MTLKERAQKELELAGLFDQDSDYNGEIGRLVMNLVDAFSDYRHSGGSAFMTSYVFSQLVEGKALSPLTDSPEEWMDVSEMSGSPWWQNNRNYSAMSHDAGKTYWLVDDDSKTIHTSKLAG